MKTPYNPEKNLVTLSNTLLKHYGIAPSYSLMGWEKRWWTITLNPKPF